jgi:hypothetical protein
MTAPLRLIDMDDIIVAVTATTRDPLTTSARRHHRLALAGPTSVIMLMTVDKTTDDTRPNMTILEQDHTSQVRTTVPILATDASLRPFPTPTTNTLRLYQVSTMY